MRPLPLLIRLGSTVSVLAGALSGCGSSEKEGSAGPDAGGDAAVAPAAVVVEHEPADATPAFGAVPFPSDLHLDAEGRVVLAAGLERIVGTNEAVLTSGLADTRGFARQGTGIFFVTGAIQPGSLPEVASDDAGASVQLVDVDPASPRFGRRYPVRARYLSSLDCIAAAALPGTVLPPGVRHALVVTTGALDSDGNPIGASTELGRIGMLPASSRTTTAERLYGEALDALVSESSVARVQDVAGLAVFTTSSMWEELFRLRERVRSAEVPLPEPLWDAAAAAPARVSIFSDTTTPSLDEWLGSAPRDSNGRQWPGGDDPAGIAHDNIGAVASFAMSAPSFLDPVTGHFERDAEGRIRLASTTSVVPVTLVVPSAPPPVSGYPVIVHGHGLSNDRGSMLSYANELAGGGFVLVGIDDVLHGTRAGVPDELNRFPGSYDGPDGIPDELPFAVSFLGGFGDFLAARDNFRQTIVDHMSLVRLVQRPDLDLLPLGTALGASAPRLDGSRVHYSGGSLGGIVGAMTAGVEPELDAVALQVPGEGFIPFIVSHSAQLADLIAGIAMLNFETVGDEPLDELHPLGLLLAQITEAGDPLAYAGAVFGERPSFVTDIRRPHLLVTYSVDDEVLPNLSTHALIRTLGIPIAGPTLVDPQAIDHVDAPVRGNLAGATAGAVQYAPSNHALGYNRFDLRQFEPGFPSSDPAMRFPRLGKDIRIEMPIREHSDALVDFFRAAANGAPEIRIAAPVRADYDADGVSDADEAAAGTDPWDPDSR